MAVADTPELGFLKKSEPWRLISSQFPSKVGGRPAWLGETGVPSAERLRCGVCEKTSAFLLQVYAPCQESFHRTIFLFCCRDPHCHRVKDQRCFKVFRNQLPRRNDTYSYDPPPEMARDEQCSTRFQLTCGLRLCIVCGCLGTKQCSRCHKANYCSREHQVMDWKVQHKKLCTGQFDFSNATEPDHNFLFPEYEIVTEHEDLESDPESLEDYTEPVAEKTLDALMLHETPLDGLDKKYLEDMARHESKEDIVFNKFKKHIDVEPEQKRYLMIHLIMATKVVIS
ncbi:programmed cell death protein 2 [Pelodytes ibericus]